MGKNQKVNSRNSKKQQQIVETAEALFIRYGMKRVTVEEICQKSEVSKMTFYKYFANKMELVKYIWDTWVKDAYKKLDKVEAMDIPFTEKLQLMQKYKLGMTAKMSSEFIDELMQMDFYAASAKKWIQRILQFLTDAQKQGNIRPEIRPEFILAMFNKLNELVDDKQLISLYPNYVEFTREVWDFFYYGIINRDQSEN